MCNASRLDPHKNEAPEAAAPPLLLRSSSARLPSAMQRLSDSDDGSDHFPHDESRVSDFYGPPAHNEVVASLPGRVSESQVAPVARTPVATSIDALRADETDDWPRCGARPPQPAETACRYLGLQVVVHLALLLVVSGVCAFVASLVTVLGASVPLCCMMNRRGWRVYAASQLLASLLYLVDLLLFALLAGLLVLAPVLGIVSNLVGLLLAAGALRYFSPSLPTTVEVQLPDQPKPILAATVAAPETHSGDAADAASGSQYVVGVVAAYAAEDNDEESR